MRKTLLFLLLLSVKLTFGQFRDDFNDGNFVANPPWEGDTTYFKVNASAQLQSVKSAVSQSVSLCTANALALNVQWEFTVEMKFDPSATNCARIYLISDNQDFNADLAGYFVQIGESGNTDSYDLYRQNGKKLVKIIDGPAKPRKSTNNLLTKIRVSRDGMGHWILSSASDGALSYMQEGATTDLSFTTSNWFGVYAKYTASRSEGFMFDDIKVEELHADKVAPQLLSVNPLNEHWLEVAFSETVNAVTATLPGNYRLGSLVPDSVRATAQANRYEIHFAETFKSGVYTLSATGISDLKGNLMTGSNEISFFYIEPYTAKPGDLVINEIYADPSPVVGLPAAEFVELWNTTDRYILLDGWQYGDLSSSHTFAADTIKPHAYLILCAKANVDLFGPYGKVSGLLNWPSLNNDKDSLHLLSAQQQVIDEVAYTDLWYRDAEKKQGGYSLELIDPQNKCAGMQNWQASSEAAGGTPGRENAVYRTQLSVEAPKLLSAIIIDSLTLQVNISKYINRSAAEQTIHYHINNGIGMPVKAIAQLPEFNTVLLQLASPIMRGIPYTLSLNGLSDCAGNLIDPAASTAQLFLAKMAAKNDILISEILVNPKAGGVDFVEIYNNSPNELDLSTLQLANAAADGKPAGIKNVSGTTHYLRPREYGVITTDIAAIQEQYIARNLDNFTEISSLPAYYNESGTVILLNKNGIIDRLDYNDAMHLPLLKNLDGVALERVSFLKPTNEPDNFKSAAQAAGFATPGYKNSQAASETAKDEVWLARQTFSPDGDGFEDELEINYRFPKAGNIASITIYNRQGIPVRRLLNNSSIANEGSFTWNGQNEKGQTDKMGIYLIKFDTFTLDGVAKHYRKACALAVKLR